LLANLQALPLKISVRRPVYVGEVSAFESHHLQHHGQAIIGANLQYPTIEDLVEEFLLHLFLFEKTRAVLI
jgi:hypothetical protein